MKNVCLLTGATGYLGSYLLRELLQETTMQIYCLIRAESLREAEKS
ncbi:MAG: SDR family oxidoreductase [Thomasclavelia spiroformis]